MIPVGPGSDADSRTSPPPRASHFTLPQLTRCTRVARFEPGTLSPARLATVKRPSALRQPRSFSAAPRGRGAPGQRPALSPLEARDCRRRLEAFEASQGRPLGQLPGQLRAKTHTVPVARRPPPPPGGAGRRRGSDRAGSPRLPPHDVDQGARRRDVRLLAPGRDVLRPRSGGPARHRMGRPVGQHAGDQAASPRCREATGGASSRTSAIGPRAISCPTARRSMPTWTGPERCRWWRAPASSRCTTRTSCTARRQTTGETGASASASATSPRACRMSVRAASPHPWCAATTGTGTSTRSPARAPTSTRRRARPTRRPASACTTSPPGWLAPSGSVTRARFSTAPRPPSLRRSPIGFDGGRSGGRFSLPPGHARAG